MYYLKLLRDGGKDKVKRSLLGGKKDRDWTTRGRKVIQEGRLGKEV